MKNRRIENIKRILKVIHESPVNTLVKYKQLESDDNRFAELMKLYSGICTFEQLIKDYNDLEIKKQLEILGKPYDAWQQESLSEQDEEFVLNNVTPIWADNVEGYIDSVLEKEEYHDIIIHSMSSFISNKIKNECNDLIEDIFDYYLIKGKNYDGNVTKFGMVLDDQTKRRLYNKLKSYMDPSVNNDPESRERLLKSLAKFGLNEKMVEQLNGNCGNAIRMITSTKRHMLSIKDHELQTTIDLLKEDGTLSYGLTYTPPKGNKYENKTEPLLVIDLPYYGQFSEHLKAEKSSDTALSLETIAELQKTPYQFPVYEIRNILLSDIPSEEASKIESLQSEVLYKKAKSWNTSDRSFAHYTALKLGATRSDLYKIYALETTEIKTQKDTRDGR